MFLLKASNQYPWTIASLSRIWEPSEHIKILVEARVVRNVSCSAS